MIDKKFHYKWQKMKLRINANESEFNEDTGVCTLRKKASKSFYIMESHYGDLLPNEHWIRTHGFPQIPVVNIVGFGVELGIITNY